MDDFFLIPTATITATLPRHCLSIPPRDRRVSVMGKHRIICGHCTHPDVVAQLLGPVKPQLLGDRPSIWDVTGKATIRAAQFVLHASRYVHWSNQALRFANDAPPWLVITAGCSAPKANTKNCSRLPVFSSQGLRLLIGACARSEGVALEIRAPAAFVVGV
jgi:hypothetical protein